MVCTGVMSACANTFAKMMFGSQEHDRVAASASNAGNAVVIAGQTQWGLPFADMVAYSINTEGMGGRPASAGMNAFGFPWCPFGRAPDVELMENEFPILIPLSQHWTDSCGAGKHRGGVGTVQPWVAHQAPMVLLMCIADNSKLQTPQPLFGGYAPCTVPGIGIRAPGLMEALKRGDDIELDFRTIIEGRTIGGQWEVEFMGRSIRPYDEGDVMGFCFSRGRRRLRRPAGGRPRGRRAGLRRRADQRVDDARDLQGRLRRGRGDWCWPTRPSGCARRSVRRGAPRDADWETFDASWSQLSPPEDLLVWFGSWPDGDPTAPVMRM